MFSISTSRSFTVRVCECRKQQATADNSDCGIDTSVLPHCSVHELVLQLSSASHDVYERKHAVAGNEHCCIEQGAAGAAAAASAAAHLCALEQDVLQEVSRAVIGIVFKPAARVDPNAHCCSLRIWVGLSGNTQAIGECGHLAYMRQQKPTCSKSIFCILH